MNKKDQNQEIGNGKTSAGEVLKKTREAKGLSLDLIHEATKIPMDILGAIEEGYKVKILSPFYLKGFMKMYAKYLEIDIDELLVDINPREKKFKKPEESKKLLNQQDGDLQAGINKVINNKYFVYFVALLIGFICLFVLVKIIGFIKIKISNIVNDKKIVKVESKKEDSIKKEIEPIKKEVKRKEEIKTTAKTVAASVNTDIKPIVKKIAEKKVDAEVKVIDTKIVDQKAVNAAEVAKAVKPVVEEKPAVETKPTVEPNPAVAPVTRSQKTNKNVVLTVRAKKSSWLRVLQDGEIVFQSTLNLGAVETWMADENIEISGKNIDQLEFELNGKMIGSLGKSTRTAKRLIVTKDGLSVANK